MIRAYETINDAKTNLNSMRDWEWGEKTSFDGMADYVWDNYTLDELNEDSENQYNDCENLNHHISDYLKLNGENPSDYFL